MYPLKWQYFEKLGMMMIRSQFPIMFNDLYGFRLQFANKQALKFAAKFIYPLAGSHSIRSSNWLIMATIVVGNIWIPQTLSSPLPTNHWIENHTKKITWGFLEMGTSHHRFQYKVMAIYDLEIFAAPPWLRKPPCSSNRWLYILLII